MMRRLDAPHVHHRRSQGENKHMMGGQFSRICTYSPLLHNQSVVRKESNFSFLSCLHHLWYQSLSFIHHSAGEVFIHVESSVPNFLRLFEYQFSVLKFGEFDYNRSWFFSFVLSRVGIVFAASPMRSFDLDAVHCFFCHLQLCVQDITHTGFCLCPGLIRGFWNPINAEIIPP